MIRYALTCASEHGFESWFRDSAAFDTLAAAGALACPVCGSAKVAKALMAPSVVTSRRKAAKPPLTEIAPVQVPAAPPAPTVLLDERQQHLRDMLRKLHREIVAQADDVGRDFAAEARRIHEGETEPRSIYGEATRTEVEELLEDGVPLMPMPQVPDDHN
jgi:hypothetical protein